MQDKVLVRKYDSMGRELLRIFYDGTQQLTMIDRRETSRGFGPADAEDRRKGKLFYRRYVEERLNITL